MGGVGSGACSGAGLGEGRKRLEAGAGPAFEPKLPKAGGVAAGEVPPLFAPKVKGLAESPNMVGALALPPLNEKEGGLKVDEDGGSGFEF